MVGVTNATIISSGNNLPPPQAPFVDPSLILSQDGYNFLINLINTLAQVTPTVTVAPTVAATGKTQATATQLSSQNNTVTSQTAGGTGVMLSALQAGQQQTVRNRTGVSISVYPQPGSQIEALGVNQAFTLTNGSDAIFSFDTATQIRT